MVIDIIPASVRDLTYIAANMRDSDWREIACQFPEGITRFEIAVYASQTGERYVATYKGQPIAAFGAAPILNHVLSLWAWGTPAMWRAVPAITRFVRDRLAPEWVAEGITRIEARSIEGHTDAHRWMEGTGARHVPSPNWGRNGEHFRLYSWTIDDWMNGHVLHKAAQDRHQH